MQIRGSVPIFWAEINTLRYKPDLQIMDLQDSVRLNFSLACASCIGYHKPVLTASLQLDAARKHFDEQVALYGETSLVSLVNHKGHEKPVKEAYEQRLNEVCAFTGGSCFVNAPHPQQLNLDKVRYEYFDFHSECKHMRWERISILLDKMQEDLIRQGYARYIHRFNH